MEIKLKTEDIKKTYSPSGTILDELAYSSGQWTEEDLRQNNFDYEHEGFDYVIEHFDFEDSLLKATKTEKGLSEIILLLRTNTNQLFENEKTDGLQAGAYYALNYPNQWNTLLKAYESKCKEEMYNEFYSNEFLTDYAPELKKELQEAEDSFWKYITREWLYGDNGRNSNGILYEIKKYWEAEEIIFNEKNWDEITLIFEDEQVKDDLENWDGGKPTIKNYKEYLLTRISDHSEYRNEKEKRQREERKAERERLTAYKKSQAEAREKERKEKLLKLTK